MEAWAMPTDDERREVAARLRGIDFSDVLFDSELVDAIEHACGSKRKRRDFVKIVDRLADLIEPDTTSDTTKPGADTTKCSRAALLALADDMRRHVAMDERSRCHRWVSPEEAVAYADRIREALGEGA